MASVSTSGVLVTTTPRAFAAARSRCSVPTPKLATMRTRAGRRENTAAVIRSATQQTIASVSWLRATISSADSGRSSGLAMRR